MSQRCLRAGTCMRACTDMHVEAVMHAPVTRAGCAKPPLTTAQENLAQSAKLSFC